MAIESLSFSFINPSLDTPNKSQLVAYPWLPLSMQPPSPPPPSSSQLLLLPSPLISRMPL